MLLLFSWCSCNLLGLCNPLCQGTLNLAGGFLVHRDGFRLGAVSSIVDHQFKPGVISHDQTCRLAKHCDVLNFLVWKIPLWSTANSSTIGMVKNVHWVAVA